MMLCNGGTTNVYEEIHPNRRTIRASILNRIHAFRVSSCLSKAIAHSGA